MNSNHEPAVHEPAGPIEPEDLRVLEEFVNTNDLERSRDALGTPLLLRDWLVDRGLAADGAPIDPEAHTRALDIREGLRALARANNHEPLDADLVRAMNEAAGSIPLTVAIRPVAGDGGWSLQPAASGVDAFLGRILGAVAGAMADGTWSRIKACRNDTCRWLFYDRSRNRSGTWCTMAVCGSRMKARAYRARRRQSASA